MDDSDYLRLLTVAAEQANAFLSNARKWERERWVCQRLLQGLNIPYHTEDFTQASQEPPDVLFGEARFEVFFVLDEGRRLNDEWREEHGDSIELVTDEHQQENPLHHLMEGNLRQRVMEAIEALPEREQLVLTLYYQEELNLKEIGAVLEVGESRVSQLHSQAIKRLRTKLGKL